MEYKKRRARDSPCRNERYATGTVPLRRGEGLAPPKRLAYLNLYRSPAATTADPQMSNRTIELRGTMTGDDAAVATIEKLGGWFAREDDDVAGSPIARVHFPGPGLTDEHVAELKALQALSSGQPSCREPVADARVRRIKHPVRGSHPSRATRPRPPGATLKKRSPPTTGVRAAGSKGSTTKPSESTTKPSGSTRRWPRRSTTEVSPAPPRARRTRRWRTTPVRSGSTRPSQPRSLTGG
jgi:hypothetical protein